VEIEIRIFEDEDGKVPFDEWFTGLRDGTARARIETRIDRLACGNFGGCAPVGEGVSEIKADFGPGYRIYFGMDGESLAVLLIGGIKDTQDRDIAVAKRYWRNYNA
jgi:putative addiction module killer protein